ncbi:MAG: hypothetical protein V4650_12725 [Pseudomonadota bacterium]
MRASLRLCLLLALSLSLTGCAVSRAANKEGVDIDDVLACQTRTCLVARGAEPLPGLKFDEANIGAYRVRKATGSTLRAVAHGILDLTTFGLWEIIGTPLEGALNRTQYYGLKVAFAADGETISRMQVAE